ncbi:hypothetical protein V6N13_114833 [Hibiscus sabdariffa]
MLVLRPIMQSLLPLGGSKIGNIWNVIRIVNEEAEASDVPEVKALPTETVVVVEETLIESTNTAQQTTTDHSRNLCSYFC